MKRKITTINILVIFLILFTSCSIQNRMTKDTIQKSIKTISEEKKGELFFENDYAILYFSKDKVLEIMEAEKKSKYMNSCNLERLNSYIKLIEKEGGQIRIFEQLSKPSSTISHFEIDFQRHLIEEFVFQSKVALFNKMTKIYESELLYKKRGGDWGCCFAGLAFSNKNNFLDTKIWSDLLIIEECNK